MPFQSNRYGLNIVKPDTTGFTATGTDYIAGIASGYMPLFLSGTLAIYGIFGKYYIKAGYRKKWKKQKKF